MLKTIIKRQHNQSCSGYSAIAMVMILLVLGGILMSELNRFSFSWQKKVIKERAYYKGINHILSSITWATTLSWPQPTNSWQCQIDSIAILNACIRKAIISTGDYTIIKGQFGQLKQYHLATYNHGDLTIEQGHWLDYCPDRQRGGDCG